MQTELATRLKDLAKKWTKHCASTEERLGVVVLEQFVNTLEPAACVWVKERKPTNSIAAAKLADDYELPKKLTDGGPKRTKKPQGPRQCFTCGKTGHLARECPKPKTEISDPCHGKGDKTAQAQDREANQVEVLELRGEGAHFTEMSQQCCSLLPNGTAGSWPYVTGRRGGRPYSDRYIAGHWVLTDCGEE